VTHGTAMIDGVDRANRSLGVGGFLRGGHKFSPLNRMTMSKAVISRTWSSQAYTPSDWIGTGYLGMLRSNTLLVWIRDRVVSRSGRYSLDLFVSLLQLKFEKFAPDDTLLDRLSKKRILP